MRKFGKQEKGVRDKFGDKFEKGVRENFPEKGVSRKEGRGN